MSTFERYLTVWVFLCIAVGVALGHLMPGVFQIIGGAEVAKVNIPVAILIWLMVIPMLLKIDFRSMAQVGSYWRGIGVTLIINWAIKPFSMALLGWLFVGWLFRPYLPADQIDSYIAGLIILAAAPCTAMVFVWSNLTRGEPLFTLASGFERRHHDRRLRADRRLAAWPLGHHRAMGDARPVRRSLHCRARHHRAGSPEPPDRRRDHSGHSIASLPSSSRCRWSRCSPPSCFSSHSRANRSSPSQPSSLCSRFQS